MAKTALPAAIDRRAGSVWSVAAGLLALAVLVSIAGLFVGGALPVDDVPGLPSAGALTTWLLPIVRLITELAAALTVGLLLAAAALLPSSRDVLSTAAVRASKLAGLTALAWAVGAIALLLLTLSQTLALPLGDVFDVRTVLSYVSQVAQGASWLTTAALAGFTAVAAREADRPVGAWVALGLAIVTLLPPAVTGHAAAAGDHDLATSSLIVHVVSASLWVGGLLALVWYARVDGRFTALAVSRFSPVALVAYLALGASGIVNGAIRLSSATDLWTTGYGRLLLAKVTAFVVLGGFGYWHRRRVLPALKQGRPHAFARFAVVEAAVMVAAVGLAVALSQSPPPDSGISAALSPAEVLLGFPMPDAPTMSNILTDWRLDILAVGLLGFAAFGYAWGIWQLRRRGDSWPVARALAWYSGLAILAFGTLSGLGAYGRAVFSIHMTQHMVLSMLAPILLVLAAPITLALRSLPAAGRNQPSGPREWLLAALNSGPVRVLTHPVTALVLFISAPYMVYFSGLFEVAMRQHWAHELMHAHFILVGYLFYESLIGIDPLPYRASYPMRLVILFSSLAFHAFFAVALMSSTSVIAPTYYQALDRPWWTDLLSDQNTGAAFAWAFGEFPGLIALVVLLFRWSQEDDRMAKRRDRQADRDGDTELAAYNAMLKRRSSQDPRQR